MNATIIFFILATDFYERRVRHLFTKVNFCKIELLELMYENTYFVKI